MLHKVMVKDLKPGMYVAELDRPWLDTPFLFQGFYLKTKAEARQLAQHCRFVYVDPLLGIDPRTVATAGSAPGKPTRPKYEITATLQDELKEVTHTWHEATDVVNDIIGDVGRGKDINAARAKGVVGGMVESVVRNPNALLWLSRLRELDTYSYSHAIDVCVYLLAFGRHLGFTKDRLRALGLGGLLQDIGKVRVRPELLNRHGKLDEEEFAEVKAHVLHGMEILKGTTGIPAEVVEMTYCHHERHDGSGYPRGLRGEQIGYFSRMSAIVDTFDALTSQRPHASAVATYGALHKLYDWRGRQFHTGLVEEFIQCIGIYPVGTLVELSTGEVGLVVAHHPYRQLKPRLMLVLNSEKGALDAHPMLDLVDNPTDSQGQEITVLRGLEPQAYGIDPKEFFI